MSRLSRLLATFAHPVERRHRLWLSALLGLVSGAVTWQSNIVKPWPRDFAQVWMAARGILRGVDPYTLVGPGRELSFHWPLLYPLPAGVIALPLAPLSANAAAVVFSIVGGAVFAYALMEHGYGPLFGFFGGALHFAAETAQWSPLLSASLVLPALGVLFVAKPTVGAAFFVARPSWWPVLGLAVFGGLAFLLQPHWVDSWLGAIRENNATFGPVPPYRAPVQLPGGLFALLCLLRWRRPEARLVAALACVPQNLMLYEAVPLFLVPRTFRESAMLVLLSYVVFWGLESMLGGERTVPQYVALSAPLMVAFLYLPVTIMVLRRPNEGPAPAWLERAIAAWPGWLRGGTRGATGVA